MRKTFYVPLLAFVEQHEEWVKKFVAGKLGYIYFQDTIPDVPYKEITIELGGFEHRYKSERKLNPTIQQLSDFKDEREKEDV